MPKRTKARTNTRKNSRKNTRKNKLRKSRRYKNHIKGGTRPSVPCEQSGSIDHHPPQWNSMIKGGSHDINHDLYNQYTDMTPYSMTR